MPTELRESACGSGMTSPRALEISEREMSRGGCGGERRRIQSFRLDFHEHPHPHDVAATERTVFGYEKSELDELPKSFDGNPGALGDLLLRQEVSVRTGRGRCSMARRIRHEDVAAGFRAEVVGLPLVFCNGSGVVRLDPHATDGIDHGSHGGLRLKTSAFIHRAHARRTSSPHPLIGRSTNRPTKLRETEGTECASDRLTKRHTLHVMPTRRRAGSASAAPLPPFIRRRRCVGRCAPVLPSESRRVSIRLELWKGEAVAATEFDPKRYSTLRFCPSLCPRRF